MMSRIGYPGLRAACLVVGLAGFTASAPGQDELAQSIVKKADLVRFPAEGFEVEVTIASFRGAEHVDTHKYKVLSKGNENTLVMTVEPASERGQILLMRARELWVFLPNVTQPVRISLAQRLTGQVANGDLARANFSGDYTARLLRTEKEGNDTYYVLELTAVDRTVTYHRVLYWVRQSNLWPHKAEFYSLSGRLLKTCAYQKFEELSGRVRPTRLLMQDALKPAERSVLDYAQMRLRDLPDRIFTKEYLKKLE
jgi:hypothetical protein